MRVGLAELKARFTEMRIDWLGEEDRFSVMIGDVEVLKAVIMDFKDWGPQRIQVSISTDEHKVTAKAALTDDEDEASISVPPSRP